jgi:hypothetical protein
LKLLINRCRTLQERVMRSKLPKILVVISRNSFFRKQKVSLSAKSTSLTEKKTVFNLDRGGGDGRELSRKPSIRVCGWTPSLSSDGDRRGRQAAGGEAGAPFELARILDFGTRLCITERCHLLDEARSLLPWSRLIRPPRPSAPDRTREQGSNRGQDSCAP